MKKILFLGIALISALTIDTQKITIITSDNQPFVIDKYLAIQSGTLRDALEDVASEDTPVPLPGITSEGFQFLQKCLKEPAACRSLLERLDSSQLVDFIKDVTYLDLQPLLNKALEVFASARPKPEDTYPLLLQLPQEVIPMLYRNHPAQAFFTRQFIKLLKHPVEIVTHDDISDLTTTHDGHYLIVSSDQAGAIKIWDLYDIQPEALYTLSYPGVRKVIVTADNHYLIAASPTNGGTINVWDLNSIENGTLVTLTNVWGDRIMITPDSRFLISAQLKEGTLRIFDLSTRSQDPLITLRQSALSDIAVTHDSRYLLTLSPLAQEGLKVWALTDVHQEPLRTFTSILGGSLMITPDNRYLILVDYAQDKVSLWDLDYVHRKPDKTIPHKGVSYINLSPDGSYLLITSIKEATRDIWNLNNLQDPLQTLKGVRAQQTAISPYNHFFASLTPEGTINVWSLSNPQPKPLRTFYHAQASIITISPDNRYLISGSSTSGIINLRRFIDEILINPSSEQALLFMSAYAHQRQATRLTITKGTPLRKIYNTLPPEIKYIMSDYVRLA